jgi:molybdopterin/thiamine biosynthesis adenylyltransferase
MMTRDLSSFLTELCTAGLLADARPVEPRVLAQVWAQQHGIRGAVEGIARVDGRELRVRIGVPARFPNVLPKVFVLGLDGRLPHIFVHGYVCYSEHDGVLLDRNDPVAIIADALRQALDLVAAGLRGDNTSEYIEELVLHWHGDAHAASMLTLREEIDWVCGVRSGKLWHFFDNRAEAQRVLPGIEPEQVLYVPLLNVPTPLDPFPEGAWKLKAITRFLMQNLTEEQRRTLNLRLRNGKRTQSTVVVRVPRPRGGDCLIGVEFHDMHGDHPLTKRSGTALVRQIRIARQDRDYFIARGGGLAEVRGCKALLIGCGAVGGHIAGELARAGIRHLTLLDPDVLRPENAYRHVLGNWLPNRILPGACAKSHLLQIDLSFRYPELELMAISANVEEQLTGGLLRLDTFDLVVVATGDPNVDRWLNDFSVASPNAPRIVYSWLEPLGLGGHAVLIAGHRASEPRAPGCLDCLFTPAEADRAPRLCNRAAFSAPGQAVTRELAACGNSFTPFGSLDAVRTAELAVRLALHAMTGDVGGALLRSWKGDPRAFRAAGYQTSNRFEASVEHLEHTGEAFAQSHCPVCGRTVIA